MCDEISGNSNADIFMEITFLQLRAHQIAEIDLEGDGDEDYAKANQSRWTKFPDEDSHTSQVYDWRY